MKCLMIKTKDHRKFFTHEKNYPQLIEFSKLFNAEISIVKVEKTEILNLKDLAPALCDSNYQKPNSNYQVLEVKVSQKGKKRTNILKNAEKIKRYIESQFRTGKVVSLKELNVKFKKHNVTTACLCSHLSKVRNKLEKQGLNIKKLGGGRYQLT